MDQKTNAGRFECGYVKVTTENFPIGFGPDAKSRRKPIFRGALNLKHPERRDGMTAAAFFVEKRT